MQNDAEAVRQLSTSYNANNNLSNIKIKNSNFESKYGFIGGFVGLDSSKVNYQSLEFNDNIIKSSGDYTGSLAGKVMYNEGEIKNNKINANTITSTGDYTGGLFGVLSGETTLEDNALTGNTINGKTNVGGMIGSNMSLTNSKSYSTTLKVSILSDNNITGTENVGGVIGKTVDINVESDVYLKNNITGSNYVGGAFGLVNPSYEKDYGRLNELLHIYTESNVTGNNYVGGIVGSSDNSYISGVVAGGIITGTGSNTGYASGIYSGYTSAYLYRYNYGYTHIGVIRSREVTIVRPNTTAVAYGSSINQSTYDGDLYDETFDNILTFSDIFDTIYGGDDNGDGYFMDFAGPNSRKLLMYKSSSINMNNLSIRGTGTESNPYILASESDFRDATLLSNGAYYFKINNDIDLSTFNHFYPIGDYNHYFNGYLDGNNKTISNMKLTPARSYTGFIPNSSGSVKNLTITSSLIKGYDTNNYITTNYIGILSGAIGQGSDDIYTNVNITNSNINCPYSSYVGGVVGGYSSKATIHISRTYKDKIWVSHPGTYNDTSYDLGVNVNFANNEIIGNNNVGGIIGKTQYNVKLTGNINLTNSLISGNSYLGGIIGFAGEDKSGIHSGVTATDYFFDNSNINLNGLHVYSRKDSSDTTSAGGLFGFVGEGFIHFNNPTTLTGVIVNSANNSYKLNECGGVAGRIKNEYTGIYHPAEMYDFNINNFQVSCNNNVGGVTGEAIGVSFIGMSLENIDLDGNNNVGGVIGAIDNTIDNNYLGHPGGIIKSVYLSGDITGNENVGGVVGGRKYYSAGTYSVSRSYTDILANDLNIEGNNYVGFMTGKSILTDNPTSYTDLFIVEENLKGVMLSGSIVANNGLGSGSASGYDSEAKSSGRYSTYFDNSVDFSFQTSSSDAYPVSSIFNGRVFTSANNLQIISMLDEVIDTYIGGDDDGDGYIFDYTSDSSNSLRLVKVNQNTFTTHLTGTGTSSDPYILSNERDFKEATLKLNGGYYFKINNDVDLSTFNHFYALGSYLHPFNGYINGNNKTISNLKLTGGKYTGLVPMLNSGYIKDLSLNNVTIEITDFDNYGLYTGSLVGYASEGSLIEGININSSNINSVLKNKVVNQSSDSVFIGGIVGYEAGSLIGININGLNITEQHASHLTKNIGGVVAELADTGVISETTVRGNISGIAGLGGVTVISRGNINHTLTNINLVNNDNSNGSRTIIPFAVNYSCSGKNIYGIVEGGSRTYNYNGSVTSSETKNTSLISSTASCSGSNSVSGVTGGKVASDFTDYTANKSITYTKDTFPASNRGDLAYYSTLTSGTVTLIDSPTNGDTDGNGWWFNTVNGQVVATRVSGSTPTPSTIAEKVGESVGTCTGGDVTPPTCTFTTFGAVSNGITAQFSCTDETSVPTIASMFNSTTKQAYTYAQILDSSRGGTEKTGTVSGTTRTVNSTWTTDYDGPKPEAGKCYYYQFAAKDACGNESDWVTTYCARGFSTN